MRLLASLSISSTLFWILHSAIDTIRDGEVVVATSTALAAPSTTTKPKRGLDKSHIAHPDEPSRIQIQIVTADHARTFAKENPKQQIEPTSGILAFEGEFISGNVTFVRVLYDKWTKGERGY